MNEYKALQDAVRIIRNANVAVCRESEVCTEPAAMLLFHAEKYLYRQMDTVLRGE